MGLEECESSSLFDDSASFQVAGVGSNKDGGQLNLSNQIILEELLSDCVDPEAFLLGKSHTSQG